MPDTSRTPNKTRQLIASGVKAQEHYLQLGLKLLHLHGTLRVRTLAYALFPNRAEKAALAAAYRVLANAADQAFIEFADEKKSRYRYYALSRSGAAYLRATGVVPEAAPTTALLNKTGSEARSNMVKANHREWTNLLAIASKQRGHRSWSETSYIHSGFQEDVSRRIGHIPDALTLFDGEDGAAAIWHEVELSRRSSGPPRIVKKKDAKTGKMRTIEVESGQTKLVKLVNALRERKVLLNREGERHTATLMYHCATPLIASEVERTIIRAFENTVAEGRRYDHLDVESQKSFKHLAVPLDIGVYNPDRALEYLNILIELLPHGGDIDKVWHDCNLPWEGAGPGIYPTFNEQFVRTVGENNAS
jgi:hypothetical protein